MSTGQPFTEVIVTQRYTNMQIIIQLEWYLGVRREFGLGKGEQLASSSRSNSRNPASHVDLELPVSSLASRVN